MTMTWIWCVVYAIGVVLTPIVFGMASRKSNHDVIDDATPTFFLALLWPGVAVVLLAMVVMVVASIPLVLICILVMELMNLGGRITSPKRRG